MIFKNRQERSINRDRHELNQLMSIFYFEGRKYLFRTCPKERLVSILGGGAAAATAPDQNDGRTKKKKGTDLISCNCSTQMRRILGWTVEGGLPINYFNVSCGVVK